MTFLFFRHEKDTGPGMSRRIFLALRRRRLSSQEGLPLSLPNNRPDLAESFMKLHKTGFTNRQNPGQPFRAPIKTSFGFITKGAMPFP
jgi:hypothetical protein